MDLKRYHESVKFLESLLNLPAQEFEQKAGDRSMYLKRIEWFLTALGNPHKNFKYIHVTGTAGKGTTAHYLHEMLMAAGKKVGSYYSPHPSCDIERIRVNQHLISPDEFSDLTDRLKPALAKAAVNSPYGAPSYFEAFLALGLLYFKKQKCEYVVLEAGLGGTYDATNVIKNPVVACVTNINYDHTAILGKTLAQIARDKAGIIKKGCSFFTGETRPRILKIFTKKSAGLKAPMRVIKDSEHSNFALASAIAKFLKLPPSAIERAHGAKKLSCRFELMQNNPQVIIDGSHNPIKLKYLAAKIRGLGGKKIFIFAMASDKDLKRSLKQIVPLADRFLITRFLMPFRKTAEFKTIKNAVLKIRPNLRVQTFMDPYQALARALKIAGKKDNIIITGSFFLAGELRKRWISEEKILTSRASL